MGKYQWKFKNMPVSADVAGAELERLAQESGCGVTPQQLVDASREENAPLHSCFEWDNDVAAEQYRLVQARALMRNIVVTYEPGKVVRVLANVVTNVGRREYVSLEKVLADASMKESLLSSARRDMEAFIAKYEILEELADVIFTMKTFMRRKNHGN